MLWHNAANMKKKQFLENRRARKVLLWAIDYKRLPVNRVASLLRGLKINFQGFRDPLHAEQHEKFDQLICYEMHLLLQLI